jgi:cytochrome c oxidase assembly factor CtaG
MANHLLLMTVAAPLILAGVPALALLRGLSRGSVSKNVVGHSAARRNPIAKLVGCWLAGTAAVIGWHLPGAFQMALHSPWLHTLESATFLLAGLLFWWPVLRPLEQGKSSPSWPTVLYLFLATLPCDILSAFLVFSDRVVYPVYLSTTPRFGMSAIPSQEWAGALMWVWVTFAYLIPAVVITMQILSPSEEHMPKPLRGELSSVGYSPGLLNPGWSSGRRPSGQ